MTPPLRNNVLFMSMRTPAEKCQDEIEEREQREHDEGICNSRTCVHCIDARERGEESWGG